MRMQGILTNMPRMLSSILDHSGHMDTFQYAAGPNDMVLGPIITVSRRWDIIFTWRHYFLWQGFRKQ